jgi:hypothetical protein
MDSLESAGVFTLVIILQFREHLVESCKPLVRQDVCWCVSVYDLFGSFFDAIDVCRGASAIFPLHATYVAELCTTNASSCR